MSGEERVEQAWRPDLFPRGGTGHHDTPPDMAEGGEEVSWGPEAGESAPFPTPHDLPDDDVNASLSGGLSPSPGKNHGFNSGNSDCREFSETSNYSSRPSRPYLKRTSSFTTASC